MSLTPDADATREIRRLDHQADRLELLGQITEAAELRKTATALAEAEAHRLAAMEDALEQIERLTQHLQAMWEAIDPRDSFAWFIDHSDDQEVIALGQELKRQQVRLSVLREGRS